jgi:hypothetical protein
MERINRLLMVGVVLSIAVTMIPLRSTYAGESTIAKPGSSADPPSDPPRDAKRRPSDYQRLLRELEAERRHVEELEREVKAIADSNSKLQQTTSTLQTSNQQLATALAQTQQQVGGVQKVIHSQFGPEGFADGINSFFGSHRFTLAGTVSTGFYYDRQGNTNTPALDFELYPLLKFNDWLQFYGNITVGLSTGAGGEAPFYTGVANFQIFPFGRDVPFELVAGITDRPFLDWYEDQALNFVNPYVTAPLNYGPEAMVPPASLGLQARGGIQWGQPGQDFDYLVLVDSGPTFESAPGIGTIPTPVIGEVLNPLTGINVATNGKGIGTRFRFYPLPVDLGWGRAELEASSYTAKWLDGNYYYAWGVGYAYRVGPFRTRGEWEQTYREMPSLPAAAVYPGCCGHDNRQGWFVQLGYFLYGIPHPYLGDWLEPRFNKTEFSVRYSGVNQRAILANDITTVPAFAVTNGSPAIFSPHAREVALALDYWIGPKIVWKNEVDFELPEAGGTVFTFAPGASTPTAGGIGATKNDTAVETQFTVQF